MNQRNILCLRPSKCKLMSWCSEKNCHQITLYHLHVDDILCFCCYFKSALNLSAKYKSAITRLQTTKDSWVTYGNKIANRVLFVYRIIIRFWVHSARRISFPSMSEGFKCHMCRKYLFIWLTNISIHPQQKTLYKDHAHHRIYDLMIVGLWLVGQSDRSGLGRQP